MSDLTPVSAACDAALRAADLTERDTAAAALVRHYAALMDHATALRDEVDAAWGDLDPDDINGHRRLAKLELAVSAQSVASDLGPKLLASLTALGCTLAGRGEKGKVPERAADPRRAHLDELKARRAQRQHGPAALDATSS